MNEFFSYVYETIFQFYRDNFSLDLLNESMYAVVGMGTTGWAVAMSATYYLLINRSSWARWYTWLIFGLIAGCIPAFLFGWLHPQADFEAQGLTYETGDYLAFGGMTALLALLVYVLVSNLLFRWFSRDCKSVPFPK